MHRRARHFKGSSVGAILHYDTRYLTDSDGTLLQTLPNRASTNYDATEATSTKRPTVNTGSNGINGQTVLSFDGIDDDLQAASVPIETYCSQFWCGKWKNAKPFIVEQSADSNTNAGFNITSQGSTTTIYWSMWLFNRSGFAQYHYAYGYTDWFGETQGLSSMRYDGSGSTNKNGVLQGNNILGGSSRTNSSATDNVNICSRNRSSLFSEGLFGCYIIANSSFSDSLTRRIEQSMGFSFKIACS